MDCTGIMEKQDYTLYYSCHPKEHKFRVGFYVKQNIKHLIKTFKPVNERVRWIRVEGKFHNFSIINAHTPRKKKRGKREIL
jgi:hypothetical protein